MSLLFDFLCISSVLGIWPRYIEPRLVKITHLKWELPSQFAHLKGLRIIQLSDLHFYAKMPSSFLDRIVRRTLRQKPDLIFFTGDFICHATLEEKERLKAFLCRLQAPQGSYCVLGNHDYSRYVSADSSGTFSIREKPHPLTAFMRSVRTLIAPRPKKYEIAEEVRRLAPHEDLMALLRDTPFVLLENTTTTLPIGLNITGLGDFALGRTRPETAFSGYRRDLPGIVLTHNPDTFPLLFNYPGEWILAGHTHGEQIHLPFCRPLSRKLTRLMNTTYTRGKYTHGSKHLYVTRGLGSPKPFRFFSSPEIVVIEGVSS